MSHASPHLMGRRSFLGGLSALAAGSVFARDYGPNAPPIRYPDPDIVVIDKKFAKYKIGNAAIQRLHTGMRWAEGPAWDGVGKYLVFSDIPNSVLMRRLEEDGHISKMRSSNNSNGNTFDYEGRLVSCEHGTRRVVRYEHSGKVSVLADKFDGKILNAPNDIVVHPDGGIWFSDPGYGSLMNYEGHKGELLLKEAVYRIDPKTTKMEKVLDDMYKPNGVCFSPDYKKLYVCDTGSSHYPEAPKNIRVYDMDGETKLGKGKEYCSMKMRLLRHRDDATVIEDKEVAGMADGIRADTDGNIWVGGGWVGEGYDGVHVFSPEGERIGLILLPEICANICFGGPKRNRLFMAASQSLYAVYVEAIGAHIC